MPYSDAIFACTFPRECTEAFLEGHVRAFEFFGGVPRRISYDNSRIAVARITGPRDRKLTDEFLRLESHHLFREHFCLVRRPDEKGDVETLVGQLGGSASGWMRAWRRLIGGRARGDPWQVKRVEIDEVEVRVVYKVRPCPFA